MSSKKKVLIVDDEPNIRLLIKGILGHDYTVLEASDGEEAVSMVRKQKPDLVLMDIMMSNVDGYTACYLIKADPATKGIPVIMLTALGYRLNEKLATVLGADGYINKPFKPQELQDVITSFI